MSSSSTTLQALLAVAEVELADAKRVWPLRSNVGSLQAALLVILLLVNSNFLAYSPRYWPTLGYRESLALGRHGRRTCVAVLSAV